jgi:hypothetical protein
MAECSRKTAERQRKMALHERAAPLPDSRAGTSGISNLQPDAQLMPTWNSGAQWSAGSLWGPSSPTSPVYTNPKKKQRTMKRQPYYPRQQADQPEWHHNFLSKLPNYATVLELSPAQLTAALADNLTLEYAVGPWITNVRDYAPACTAALEVLAGGTGGGEFVFPLFILPPPPTLPVGADPVIPGALDRTFNLVKGIKSKPGYTLAIGIDLGIVGEEAATEYTRPSFTLKLEGVGPAGCNCVKLRHKKYGHYAVAIYSKRGTGDWELLAISRETPYLDERALLVPGQPEIRQYKMRFWDSGSENGDWTDVATATVSV